MYSSMYDACGIFGQMRQWQWNIIRIGGEGAEVVQPPSYGCTVPMGGGCWGGGAGEGKLRGCTMWFRIAQKSLTCYIDAAEIAITL